MKSFLHYLVESIKEYEYRIRSIVPLDAKSIEKLEYVLDKYNLVTISKPKKTILQDSPLDFPNAGMVEVYFVDVTTTVPLSPEVFTQELTGALKISWSEVSVRGKYDPVEVETEILNSENHGVNGTDEDPLLSTNLEYKEHDYKSDDPQAYGDEYNKRFLAYLAKVAAERDEAPVVVQPENQKKSIFQFFGELEDSEDFNKDYDTPKPVPTKKAKKTSPLPAKTSNEGNFLSRLSR